METYLFMNLNCLHACGKINLVASSHLPKAFQYRENECKTENAATAPAGPAWWCCGWGAAEVHQGWDFGLLLG